MDAWFALPTADWAGSLVSLALAIVSAGAAFYGSLVVPWAAALGAATSASKNQDGKLLDPTSAEGSRALRRLEGVRAEDPRKGVGIVVLSVSALMTALGSIAGLQIPNVGYLYTVVPVVVAAVITVAVALLPGRDERKSADETLRALRAPAATTASP
jgi:hypothetical protein